jgi:hypothetical protein
LKQIFIWASFLYLLLEVHVDLAFRFKSSANVGVLAGFWLEHLKRRMAELGCDLPVKTGADGAVSLIAPAALLATFIGFGKARPKDRALRILVVSDDPIGLMDDGVWCNYAADFAGVEHGVDLYSTSEQTIQSNLFPAASVLGLKPFTRVSRDEAQNLNWDLAAWIHPALETTEGSETASLMERLERSGVPVYACMYNELDAMVQAYGANTKGVDFRLVGSTDSERALSSESVNRFGISVQSAGIDGGWGAVMAKLERATETFRPSDWRAVKTAMNLVRLEGVREAPWVFGQTVAGVAFGKSKPVGLIGDLAVDSKSGQVLCQCPITKVLNVVGYVWEPMLSAMPADRFKLLPWAARIKLCFAGSFSKEAKPRQQTIELLSQAYRTGTIEAGIALARGYESIGTGDALEKAYVIYREIGARHPMSAYALAHDHLNAGRTAVAEQLLDSACRSGYIPAMTDYAKLNLETEHREAALQLIGMAAAKGDPEANFIHAEELIRSGCYLQALQPLRRAWSAGHEEALRVAEWLCSELLSKGIGKSGALSRELKDVRFFASKRVRHEAELRKAIA